MPMQIFGGVEVVYYGIVQVENFPQREKDEMIRMMSHAYNRETYKTLWKQSKLLPLWYG